MWYENSDTLANLGQFPPLVGSVLAVTALVAIAMAAFRYFFGEGDPLERVAVLRTHVGQILGFAVVGGLLVGGALGTNMMTLFSDTAGLDAIKGQAQSEVDNPFRPTNEEWQDLVIGSQNVGGGGWKPPSHYETEHGGAAPADPSVDAIYSRVDDAAASGNRGADWANAFVALHRSGCLSEADVEADPETAGLLASYGINDLSDPILYDGSAGSTRGTLEYWEIVLDRKG